MEQQVQQMKVLVHEMVGLVVLSLKISLGLASRQWGISLVQKEAEVSKVPLVEETHLELLRVHQRHAPGYHDDLRPLL